MKYENFNIEDFIADEFFISWIKQESKEVNLFWQLWISEHPEKIDTIQKAREIILNAQPKRIKPSKRDYTEVLEGILSPKKQALFQEKPRYFDYKNTLKFAASISILLIFLGWLFLLGEKNIEPNVNDIQEVALITKQVPFGQKSTIILSDGSKVKLNAGAKLIFPKTFENSQTREVQLFGEAFFEVTRDNVSFG